MTARADGPRGRPTLAWLLVAALLLLIAMLFAMLWFVLAPTTRDELDAYGRTTLEATAAAMQELTDLQTEQNSRVLVDLIRQTASSSERALIDLPLESYGGDVAAMRAAVLSQNAERADHQRHNVEILAAEIKARAARDIGRRLAALSAAQAGRSIEFFTALRRTHLWLVAVTLLALLGVLGVGLHRLVVLPTRRLRQAAQRVAEGELCSALPRPSVGELGDLARDFAGMVAQLRQSREQLQSLADNLEAEVANKTQHLEQALHDLQASHRQLAQTERLAALGTLAGGMAHEFHNVIGGIRGCAGELLADEVVAERVETLAVITRAADRAAGIVQQLQRFARHPIGDRVTVSLADLLGDALRLCEPAARRQQVAIEREFETGLSVTCDADGLHQVFVNLMINALQAMPDGGTLRLSSKALPGLLRITVEDTGTGIPAEVLPRVFEPFFTTRADVDDPAQRGTGLGLSVSYGIVKAHDGEILVESQPGRGTVFTIDLPR